MWRLTLGLVVVAVVAGCGSSSNVIREQGSDSGSSSGGGPGGSSSSGGSTATGGSGPANTGGASSSGTGGKHGGVVSDGSIEASSVGAVDAGSTSDVIGKVTVGYQGWFTAPGDGAPFQGWWHYDSNTSKPPSPADNQLKGWPDMTDFMTGFQTGFADLNNGKPATLFSSYTTQTVDTHFRWMEENGIDTAALQRFSDNISTRNGVALKVMNAAVAHGRKFYVMYDISGWTNFQTDLKSDWTNVIEAQLKLTESPAYAMQDGKPVVCIWGMGFNDRPGDAASSLDVINFFKAQGVYLIGGVPVDWLAADGGSSKQGYGAVYDAFDMLSPWMIGVIGDSNGSDSIRKSRNEPDIAHCRSKGIAYQPCVEPGDLSVKQRKHGDYMWHQFANMIQLGADGIYVSMFDEFGEGNQIAKTAATPAGRPSDSSLPTLDEDGTACSSDYYLRLTGDGGKMLKGQIPLTFTRPTPTE